jgi:hypothetical protein
VSEADSMQLIVSASGEMRCLYGEEIPLATLGSLSIVRASYVEPNREGLWFADLSPVGGPQLGPHEHRSLALEEERKWLQRERLGHEEGLDSVNLWPGRTHTAGQ